MLRGTEDRLDGSVMNLQFNRLEVAFSQVGNAVRDARVLSAGLSPYPSGHSHALDEMRTAIAMAADAIRYPESKIAEMKNMAYQGELRLVASIARALEAQAGEVIVLIVGALYLGRQLPKSDSLDRVLSSLHQAVQAARAYRHDLKSILALA